MERTTKTIRISLDTYQRLKKFKGGRTWDEFFEFWLKQYEGLELSDNETRWITNLEWKELSERVEKLEEQWQRSGIGSKRRK